VRTGSEDEDEKNLEEDDNGSIKLGDRQEVVLLLLLLL